jgi:pSer/pThr/pTyr-binding forkhead associated (FHA) protein
MNLKELEARIQHLIEVRLVSILPGQNAEDVVTERLAAAMHSSIITQEGGSVVAPNVFTIIVNPAATMAWQRPELLEELIAVLKTVGEEAGLVLASQPQITISTDKSLALNDISVRASHRLESLAETKGMQNDNQDDGKVLEHIPENAFLIIEGVKVYALVQTVVNIGRRMDNQLVIDDPRVSRNHAQLRAINGRFVLFDLNSTGGTFVNGQRTNQTILYPGDVISLAGVALIFGQDNPPPRTDTIDTVPLQPAVTDRPTAIIREHSTAKIKKQE